MEFNDKAFFLPPHISTSWDNIDTIFTEKEKKKLVLIIILKNKQTINIPDLSIQEITDILKAHQKFLKKEKTCNSTKIAKPTPNTEKPINTDPQKKQTISFGFPLGAINDPALLENLGSIMQHNPEQSNAAPLPPEMLNKIASLSKLFGKDTLTFLPKAEPHCNCPYCQVARALHKEEAAMAKSNKDIENEDKIVSEDELKFRSWNIKQIGDKLYIVTNSLDLSEHYQVFLGAPLGCTCGKKNCEHIHAVLNS